MSCLGGGLDDSDDSYLWGPRCQNRNTIMIFVNKDRSYHILGVPHNVLGVCYRTEPKWWMEIGNREKCGSMKWFFIR